MYEYGGVGQEDQACREKGEGDEGGNTGSDCEN